MNITNEELQYLYDHSPNKSHLLRALHIRENQNGLDIDFDLLLYLSRIGIKTREQISGEFIRKHYKEVQEKEYYQNPKHCKRCGKVIPFERRKNSTNTCSSKCANILGNSRVMTDEIKKKISEGCRSHLASNGYILNPKNNRYTKKAIINDASELGKVIVHKNKANKSFTYVYDLNKYSSIFDLIKEGKILNIDNYDVKPAFVKLSSLKIRVCKACGKEYYGRIASNGKISDGKTCCEKCHHDLFSNIAKEIRAKEIAAGTFKGWMSRNVISYAEKFWIKVLDNNNISYVREYKLSNPNSSQYYFLDFYIEIGDRKIDLEIDGKQHLLPERIEHDRIRDEYVKSVGIEVYRIPWNKMISEKGCQLMKEKIDKFLEYIK